MGFMRMSDLWKVNGYPIPEPSYDLAFEYTSLSAEGSGRRADGYMHNVFVRTRLAKVSIRYAALTKEALSYILDLVQGREFELTYPDPLSGTTRTMTCICAESRGKYYSAVLYGGLYRDVTFNCVES